MILKPCYSAGNKSIRVRRNPVTASALPAAAGAACQAAGALESGTIVTVRMGCVLKFSLLIGSEFTSARLINRQRSQPVYKI